MLVISARYLNTNFNECTSRGLFVSAWSLLLIPSLWLIKQWPYPLHCGCFTAHFTLRNYTAIYINLHFVYRWFLDNLSQQMISWDQHYTVLSFADHYFIRYWVLLLMLRRSRAPISRTRSLLYDGSEYKTLSGLEAPYISFGILILNNSQQCRRRCYQRNLGLSIGWHCPWRHLTLDFAREFRVGYLGEFPCERPN